MPERQGVFRILSLLLVLEGDLKTIVVYKALPGRRTSELQADIPWARDLILSKFRNLWEK